MSNKYFQNVAAKSFCKNEDNQTVLVWLPTKDKWHVLKLPDKNYDFCGCLKFFLNRFLKRFLPVSLIAFFPVAL